MRCDEIVYKNVYPQEKRFEQERTALLRQYESDLENMIRHQRQQIERLEAQQEAELRLSSKRIRAEQVNFSPFSTKE